MSYDKVLRWRCFRIRFSQGVIDDVNVDDVNQNCTPL